MTSKTENFYKSDKVAWEVSKPGYLPESGEVTLLKDEVIDVELLKDTDWIKTNIQSEINTSKLTFADRYTPSTDTINTPFSVRDHKHKLIGIDTNSRRAYLPINNTEGLTEMEVYSDFLNTFVIGVQMDDIGGTLHKGTLEKITLPYTPMLTTFSVEGMSKLKELHVDDFSHVTSMDRAFRATDSLEYVSPMYLDSCTSMSRMFEFGRFLTLPIIPQHTQNVTDTSYMFNSCSNISEIPLFDTSNVTDMSSMFGYCPKLTTVPLFDTSSVTNMRGMFATGMYNRNIIYTIPNFNTSNVTDMNSMFYGCRVLQSIPQLDASNVADMGLMFEYCSSLTDCGGFINLKANLDMHYSPLTHESAMNIINNAAIVTNRTIKFSTVTYNTLSDADIKIATDKGWRIVVA